MLAKKALSATAGAPKLYVEDVMSCFLYTGNGSTQTITNNIDLSTEGGLVWIKKRDSAVDHVLQDTERGTGVRLTSNTTNGNVSDSTCITAFNNNGFALGSTLNSNAATYVSWTFRQAKKFFDVVTFTTNGSEPPNTGDISHNLGSTPGCVIVKSTSGSQDWKVYHRSLSTPANKYLELNSTGAVNDAGSAWISVSSTTISFPGSVLDPGVTYVAYLFAHDAGGFGDAGSDSIIKCGSFTTDGSGNATVDLGWEPQWILAKGTSTARDWWIFDNMREMSFSNTLALRPNLSNAEYSFGSGIVQPTATGFNAVSFDSSGVTWAYIAIRRGPMKTPTSGTEVFYPQAVSQADTVDSTNVPFPPDLVNTSSRNGTNRSTTGYLQFQFADRLRSLGTPNDTLSGSGCPALISSSTAAEATSSTYIQLKADGRNITKSNGWNNTTYGDWIYYFFRRAPGFFDVVCYTGTGVSRTVSHNLGVTPELMIVKARSQARDWLVYSSGLTSGYFIKLNLTDAQSNSNYAYIFGNDTSGVAPTSSVFTVGSGSDVNASGSTYVAYLFASVSGVSKVGTYTGNGSSVTVTTDFQPRFILVKRTDSTGDWLVSDSARGLVAGNDPYLELNTTDAEVTNEDWVDISSTSFTVNQTTNNANVNTGTYIYLAIA